MAPLCSRPGEARMRSQRRTRFRSRNSAFAGPLAEPAHEVRVPLRPVRRRDEHLVAARGEVELELRPHAVEHLELEPVAADAVLLGEA